MRVTIVKDDNTVIVDGVGREVDCSALPSNFHALQWDGSHGEVEYAAMRCACCGARSKRGNDIISELGEYQVYVDRWNAAAEEAKPDAA